LYVLVSNDSAVVGIYIVTCRTARNLDNFMFVCVTFSIVKYKLRLHLFACFSGGEMAGLSRLLF